MASCGENTVSRKWITFSLFRSIREVWFLISSLSIWLLSYMSTSQYLNFPLQAVMECWCFRPPDFLPLRTVLTGRNENLIVWHHPLKIWLSKISKILSEYSSYHRGRRKRQLRLSFRSLFSTKASEESRPRGWHLYFLAVCKAAAHVVLCQHQSFRALVWAALVKLLGPSAWETRSCVEIYFEMKANTGRRAWSVDKVQGLPGALFIM